MVVELIYRETLDILQESKAKSYIKSALDIINFMVDNNLDSINGCGHYFMALSFDECIYSPELYGRNNYCRALGSCKGRLPNIGNVLCYLSQYRHNIEIVLVNKEDNIYFSLDLYTMTPAAVRCGVTFDTEKFE